MAAAEVNHQPPGGQTCVQLRVDSAPQTHPRYKDVLRGTCAHIYTFAPLTTRRARSNSATNYPAVSRQTVWKLSKLQISCLFTVCYFCCPALASCFFFVWFSFSEVFDDLKLVCFIIINSNDNDEFFSNEHCWERKENVGKIGDLGVGGLTRTLINIFFPPRHIPFFCLFFLFANAALVINFTGNFLHLVHSTTSRELMGYGGRRRLRKSTLFPGGAGKPVPDCFSAADLTLCCTLPGWLTYLQTAEQR